MEETEHCMLVGRGAKRFARSIGMEIVPTNELLTPRELERLEGIRKMRQFRSRSAFEPTIGKKGTVGAVAMDVKGCIAAATSTGGTPNKMPGRVGDSPLIGCGTYADSGSAGVSATGWRESIMNITLARRVCEAVEGGADAAGAAKRGIDLLGQRVKGLGGVKCLDRNGRSGYHYNTPRMAVAWIGPDGEEEVNV